MNDEATEALIAAYAAGDFRVWEPLFDRLAPRLLAFFQRCVRDPVLAETHVQVTFVQLHRARRTYRPGMSGRRWVFTIATRARVGDRSCFEHPASDCVGCCGSTSVHGESAHQRGVRQAIDSLASIERSIIHLHRFEGMSLQEIGAVFGWTESAVRSHTFRAYNQLRERLWELAKAEGS